MKKTITTSYLRPVPVATHSWRFQISKDNISVEIWSPAKCTGANVNCALILIIAGNLINEVLCSNENMKPKLKLYQPFQKQHSHFLFLLKQGVMYISLLVG